MTSTEAGYYDQSYPPSIYEPPVPPGPVDPAITSLAPTTGSAAAGPLTVEVTGTDFEAGSVVEVDQVPASTTVFVSATHLTATFDPAAAGTVQFTVRNVNDEESNSAPFIVTA